MPSKGHNDGFWGNLFKAQVFKQNKENLSSSFNEYSISLLVAGILFYCEVQTD